MSDSNVRGGVCLVPESDELFAEQITGKEQKVQIPTEEGAYYLARYQSQGSGKSPLFDYEQSFPIGSSIRKHAYMSSYEPPMLPRALKEHERLLISDGQPMNVRVKDKYVGDIKKISYDAYGMSSSGNWWDFGYGNGRVIPGSSGSPFFDSNKRIRGMPEQPIKINQAIKYSK